jgi:hypothetical protein
MTPEELAASIKQMIDEAERKALDKAADFLDALAKAQFEKPMGEEAVCVLKIAAMSIRQMTPSDWRRLDVWNSREAARRKFGGGVAAK